MVRWIPPVEASPLFADTSQEIRHCFVVRYDTRQAPINSVAAYLRASAVLATKSSADVNGTGFYAADCPCARC